MTRGGRSISGGILVVLLAVACAPTDVPPEEPSSSGGVHAREEGTDARGRPLSAVGPAGPDSTGVSQGVDLEPSDLRSVDQEGSIIEGVHIRGDLTVDVDRVTLRNVRIEGKLQVRGDDVVVEDSELGTMAISTSERMVVRRVEVFGALGQDGIHVTSGRATVRDLLIEDSWIHSPWVDEGSHYDGIQVRGVDGLTVRRTTIDLGEYDPRYTAAIFLEDANGGNTDVMIEQNLLNGGGYTLYLSGQGVTVRGNLFGSDAGYGAVYPDTHARELVFEENAWLDGEPIALSD